MTATHPLAHLLSDALDEGALDTEAAVYAAESFLTALGLRAGLEDIRHSAERMAASYVDLLAPRTCQATTFASLEGNRGLVIARSLPFASLCAHHLLPFVGTATVGYLPGERLLGLSKLARAVAMFAARPQVQEDMTQQVAGWLEETLPDSTGVGVLVTAEHLCMTVRGAQARGASTLTTAWRGRLVDDASARTEFLSLARGQW